jgi:hypothetical protein
LPSNTTASSPLDQTGLQDSEREINSAHLVELARRSVGRSEVSCEMAIAWTVITRPYICGTRGLARWSGNTSRTVREITGPNGGTSAAGYLWTGTRGVSSPLAEDRESMQVRYSDTRTQGRSTSLKLSNPSNPSLSLLDKKEGKINFSTGNAPLSAPIGERAQEALDQGMKTLSTLDELNRTHDRGYVLTALDPGLDLWTEIEGEKPKNAAVRSLGRRAWVLAVLCGLEDVVLSTDDVAALLGLSKRGAQDLLARMRGINPFLVGKIREGRSIVYEIRWASTFRKSGDGWETCWTDDLIRKARQARDMKVQATSARRGTPAGYTAYLHSTANAKRDEYLAANPLPADADPVWAALVEEGDELKLHEHLLAAKEAEAGAAPDSPEALDAPVEAEPARESVLAVAARQRPLSAQEEAFAAMSEVGQQTWLAEMRKRMMAPQR